MDGIASMPAVPRIRQGMLSCGVMFCCHVNAWLGVMVVLYWLPWIAMLGLASCAMVSCHVVSWLLSCLDVLQWMAPLPCIGRPGTSLGLSAAPQTGAQLLPICSDQEAADMCTQAACS